ncbi:MAG: RnfABCDGE type electron transport complex subunit B [FCB group bacterium]|nr:RnfABCDGE type electron transport complex subunit B [FCB group bacterium]
MDINALIVSMVSMGGMGFLFSLGLSLAGKKLQVEEDPRVALIREELPGANCGGCGYPGCGNFAENLTLGKSEISGCPVCNQEAADAIAAILGVEVESRERQVARVMCQGGLDETAKKGTYAGIQSCIAATLVHGGDKLCDYGCIGFGDCVQACTFDAMYMSANGLPVVLEDRCTGCGNCASACPRGIMELHPVSHTLFVLCKNEDGPKEARQTCLKACIGCGICVRAVNEGEMIMENNLAKINYDVYGHQTVLPTDKCSTNCLVVVPAAEQSSEKIAA